MEEPKEYKECQVILKDIRTKIIYRIVEDNKVQNNVKEDKQLDKKSKTSKYKCKICDEKFGTETNRLKHMKCVHPNDLLECHICQRNFIKNIGLEQHMKMKHFDGKIQLFECDFCGKLTKTKSEMHLHMKVHLPTIKCHICQTELKKNSIKTHMEQTHATDRKFSCKMCPKMFKTRYLLRKHEKFHDRKFQCTTCMKKFVGKSKLLMHQRNIHENPGSYSCEMCNIKFNERGNLKRHQKTHERNRPKPLKCYRCEYATDIKTNYERHMKSHQRQDEKFAAMKNPLKCPKCPSLCRNKDILKRHLKEVHPDESFQCDLCGKYLKVFSGLKRHIDLHQRKKNL